MTVIIDVRYPFGFVHATPWGTHVNEGAVEWPPSPWRLLHALVSTWRTRAPELPDDVVVSVPDALAAAPAVRMAPRTEASLRTYLPPEKDRSGARDTARVAHPLPQGRIVDRDAKRRDAAAQQLRAF